MKIPFWPKYRWLCASLLIVVVIFVPYLFSRAMSPWRCVTIYSTTYPTPKSETTISTPNRLRIACYNIAHGRGLATSNWEGGSADLRQERLDEIGELIKQTNADVVILNEVDFDSSWSNGINQAEYLAKIAGYPYRVEQRNYDFRVLFWRWRFGNAVLSRYPISSVEVLNLDGYSSFETAMVGKKQGIVSDLQYGDQTVRIFAVHLSHRSESLRVASAELMNHLAKASPHPVIVAGDLNSTPRDFPQSKTDKNNRNAIETFDHGENFQRQPISFPKNDSLTFHADDPKTVIDWILIPKNWKYISYRVLSSKLSDHRPVVAEVEFDLTKNTERK